VAYDAINERHFVWGKMMRVDRPSVLPDMDRDLPKVEFVDLSQVRPHIPEYLPVQTQAPVEIDVVFNLTGNQQLSLTANNIDGFRPPYAEDALRGATALLSQLAPSQGCVRLSAIDILRLKVSLDRSSTDPASNLNQIQQAIPSDRDKATIDAHTLVGRTKAREFFHQFLEKSSATTPHAAHGSPKQTAPSSSSAIALSSPKAPTGSRYRPPNIAMSSSSMSSSRTPGLLLKIRCLPSLSLSMRSDTCSATFTAPLRCSRTKRPPARRRRDRQGHRGLDHGFRSPVSETNQGDSELSVNREQLGGWRAPARNKIGYRWIGHSMNRKCSSACAQNAKTVSGYLSIKQEFCKTRLVRGGGNRTKRPVTPEWKKVYVSEAEQQRLLHQARVLGWGKEKRHY
jgi:hypothetical protein